MDTHSYDITRASLTPHAVQPIHRGGGDKIEPIEFTLAEHTDTNTRSNFWADLRYRADDFRLWLATRCCACLSSVPSLALVIIAAVLIMLLIATIPLAFALTYISPQASTVSDSTDPNEDVRFFVHRPSTWPNESDMVNYKDWEDHVPVRSNLLLPKNISTCTVYGFACTGKPHIVIPKNRRCDGYADCEDGSDELDCHECQTTLFCPATDSQHSQRKLCLIGAHLCDNHTYCPNGEDETIYCQATCDDGQFKCRDADICIPEEAVCDGEPQCPFGDDEQSCTGECNNGAKKCGKDMCLAKRVLCDGYADCSDLSDEQDCDCSSCSGKNSALCNGDQKLCIAKEKVCDGRTDCPGGEDENGCHGVCPVTKASLEKKKKNIGKRLAQKEMIKCADGRLHHWEEACNGDNPECSQSCSKCDPEMAFQCQSEFTQRMGNLSVIGFRNVSSRSSNGSAAKEEPETAGRLIIHRTFKECIHRSLVCDGKPDCSDASDELHCNCGGPETIKCRQDTATTMLVTHCYLKSQKCDGFADCAGKEDELGCDSCANGAFLCKNESRCIPSMARCDGIADCQDLSDETNCTCEECTRQPTQMYMCAGSNRCFPLESICGPYTMCPNATKLDHLFCAVRGKEYF